MALVPGNHIDLVDLDHALKLHPGGRANEAFLQARSHRMDVVFVQAQFPGDLQIGEVQPHEIQAQYPDPERLVMARQDCSGQVVEAAAAAFATVALAVALLLVVTIADHRTTRTTRTAFRHLAFRWTAFRHVGVRQRNANWREPRRRNAKQTELSLNFPKPRVGSTAVA
jgi:hypothetical protein